MLSPSVALANIFQSTLSVRRATSHRFCLTPIARISIHALRKESDSTPSDCQPNPFISIHALRKESDLEPPI